MLKVPIPKKGYGTMAMTFSPTPKPFAQSVALLKHLYEKNGVTLFNGATIYHMDPKFANIKLFAEFFKAVPPKDVVLTFKIGVEALPTFKISSKPEDLDKSIKNINNHLEGLEVRPKLIVVIGRIDKSIPIEDTVKYLYENHVKKGTIDGIGLSECGAETITKAAKAGPISVLELEFSLLSQHLFELGILKVASEYEIPIICYSPLGRGLLTDAAIDPDFIKNLSSDDPRVKHRLNRFLPENFEKNCVLFKKLGDFAHKKNKTLSQLAIGYIYAVSGATNFEGIPLVTQLVPIPGGSSEVRVDSNYDYVELSDNELKYIQGLLNDFEIAGVRYNKAVVASGMLNA